MLNLNQKPQDKIWQKEKQKLFTLQRSFKEELAKKIEDEIFNWLSESGISKDSDKISLYILPFKNPNSTDKDISFMLKLICQEFVDSKKKELVHATVKKIKIQLNNEPYKVVGPTCCEVNATDIYISVLPLFLYYNENNCIDVSKDVIYPLLHQINPLALFN